MKKTLLAWVMLWGVIMSAVATPVEDNGKLRVEGVQLVNEAGNPVQLRGMSSHGLQWDVGYNAVSKESLTALRDEWGADIFRAAMYVGEGGYASNSSVKSRVYDIIRWTEELGIYCLIDWHVHDPGDPTASTYSGASDFFDEMSDYCKDKKHVLYEICNEPNPGHDSNNPYDDSWATIKEYAEEIIPVIRKNDPTAVVIVGTPTWSQLSVWDNTIVNNQLDFDNIMYTFHFYAGSHGDLQPKFKEKICKLPVFVTEWGTSAANGNGDIDTVASKGWLDILAGDNSCGVKISWCNWSFSDKAEGSAALSPGAATSKNWTNTTASGTWVRNRMLQPDTWIPACVVDVAISAVRSTIEADISSGAYTFTLNGSSNTTGTFTDVADGTHTVTVDDGAGCSVSFEVTVNNATYSALATAISEAKTQLADISVGTEPGNVSSSAHTTYSSAIDVADLVEKSTSATVQDALDALSTLAQATANFEAAIIQDASQINTDILASQIEKAEGYYDTYPEGTESGEYPTSAFTALQSAITSAKSVESTPISQSSVDAEVLALKLAIQSFLSSKIIEEVTELWVDKCEDGDEVTEVGGKWYTYDDSGDGGKSIVSPDAASFTMDYEGYNSSRAAKMTFSLDGGTCSWCPNVGMGFNLKDPEGAYDLTGAESISFYHKGKGFILQAGLSTITNYQSFESASIPDHSNWTLVTINFSDLAQPDWGDNNKYVAWDLKKVTKFQFKIGGNTDQYNYILIDDVKFNGDFTPEPVNNEPTIDVALSDVSLPSGFGAKAISLATLFEDLDGDILDISVKSSASTVVKATISGSSLTLAEMGAGTATITVTADDGNGGTISDSFTVVVAGADPSTGIVAVDGKQAKVFPIPFTNELSVLSDKTIDNIRIVSLSGVTVLEVVDSPSSVDVSELQTGFYLIQVTYESGKIEVFQAQK